MDNATAKYITKVVLSNVLSIVRGGVEDSRLEAKNTKKNLRLRTTLLRTDPLEANDRKLEAKDIGASILQKKSSKKFSGNLHRRKTRNVFANFPQGFWRFPTKF